MTKFSFTNLKYFSILHPISPHLSRISFKIVSSKNSLASSCPESIEIAFFTKDNSKLELVVKVKNCNDPNLLPIVKKCDILKQYCLFIEIVEQNYNKLLPKKSFKRAIEIAMERGILTDYLDRKSREVINMLCAKYDYKMDIAVKQKAVEKIRELSNEI